MASSKQIADRICGLIEARGNRAISEQELRMQLINVNNSQLQRVLEELTAKKRIRVHEPDESGALSFEAFKGRTDPVKVTLQLIRDASGNGGIFYIDLRRRSKLTEDELKRALKLLEKQGLIWKTKSITNKNVYTVVGLRAGLELTGGACFKADSSGAQLVVRLKTACLKAVYERNESSYRKMMENIHSTDDTGERNLNQTVAISASELFEQFRKGVSDDATYFSKYSLNVVDVEHVLEILLFEGKVMKVKQPTKEPARYRYSPYNRDNSFFSAPCMDCPDYQRCLPQSTAAAMAGISPDMCPFLNVDHLIFK